MARRTAVQGPVANWYSPAGAVEGGKNFRIILRTVDDYGRISIRVPSLTRVQTSRHIHVAHGDAAVGPSRGCGTTVRDSLRRQACRGYHDHAAGLHAFATRAGGVAGYWGRRCALARLKRSLGLAPVDPVQAFRGAAGRPRISLWPLGVFAQGNAGSLDRLAVVDQLQLMGGLEHQDFFDGFAAQGLHG